MVPAQAVYGVFFFDRVVEAKSVASLQEATRGLKDEDVMATAVQNA